MRPPIPFWFDRVLKFANGDPAKFWSQSLKEAAGDALGMQLEGYVALHEDVRVLLQRLTDAFAHGVYFPGDGFLGQGLEDVPHVIQREVRVKAAEGFVAAMKQAGREDEPAVLGALVLLDGMASVEVLADAYGGDSVPLLKSDRRPWPLDYSTEHADSGFFFRSLDNVVVAAVQRRIRLFRCRSEKCGKFGVDDRNVKDRRRLRLYCGDRCRNGYHNARRPRLQRA